MDKRLKLALSVCFFSVSIQAMDYSQNARESKNVIDARKECPGVRQETDKLRKELREEDPRMNLPSRISVEILQMQKGVYQVRQEIWQKRRSSYEKRLSAQKDCSLPGDLHQRVEATRKGLKQQIDSYGSLVTSYEQTIATMLNGR